MIKIEHIKEKIVIIRGERVMLDRDLAELYGVETKRLNEQVERNINRFPADFMFQLNVLKYSTSNPYVFTEHGAIMIATILNSTHGDK